MIMAEKEKYGFILCVCTGKCPGFEEMDIWDLEIGRAHV
jgi:hypothetical protein